MSPIRALLGEYGKAPEVTRRDLHRDSAGRDASGGSKDHCRCATRSILPFLNLDSRRQTPRKNPRREIGHEDAQARHYSGPLF